MTPYTTTPDRRKRPNPDRISNDYWQAFNRLYGRNRSGKTSRADATKLDDLNAENVPEVSS